MLNVTNLPIWVFICTFLAPIHDFNPKDITILKSSFDDSFTFKYISDSQEDKEFLSQYVDIKNYNFPIILWNSESYDSIIGQWYEFMREYLIYIKNINTPREIDIVKELEKFRDTILNNREKCLAFENLVAIICEEYPTIHEYNVFNIFSQVVGFSGIITEKILEQNENVYSEKMIELLSDIQERLYFLTLKSMARFCHIKYGTNFSADKEIAKGDVVIDEDCECLMEVKRVSLEPENKTDDNPDGITYLCQNLINKQESVKLFTDVKMFHVGFLDVGEYNEKHASVLKKEAQNISADVYKKMLERFLKYPKRPNPLDEKEEEIDFPTFESALNEQRKVFHRTEGDAVLENMLNDCRKVKTYGQ